ncbi:hypothetical protein TBH_C1759 [Thiolapillus brandeum]|uniref:Uncharacterized protein n=2 Tax=Thiolapillus brandeum TaxID=1076588 RepID=A0A7U6JHU4_9GAMM|nr:hypothetical protein TBH_C1759 [Thiolapillus brandeum]
MTAGNPALLYGSKHLKSFSAFRVDQMKKSNCCIAIFPDHAGAVEAIDELKKHHMDDNVISLVGKDVQYGKVGVNGLSSLNEDLTRLGVQEATLYCYQCMVHNGSFLVIVTGNHDQVEAACDQLEKHAQADVALHFNAP